MQNAVRDCTPCLFNFVTDDDDDEDMTIQKEKIVTFPAARCVKDHNSLNLGGSHTQKRNARFLGDWMKELRNSQVFNRAEAQLNLKKKLNWRAFTAANWVSTKLALIVEL